MSVSKVRSKTTQKLRNILRNNVADLDKYRVAKAFFPAPNIIPWWAKPKKRQSIIKRKSEVKSKK